MLSRSASFLCLLGIAVSGWSAEVDNRSYAGVDARRKVTVGPNDTIIPHIADGATWQTTIVLTNLIDGPVYYGMDFRSDSGEFQPFDIVGTGKANGLVGIIPTGATIYISTAGTSSTLTQGWGRIGFFDRPAGQPGLQGVTARAGGYAIFRRRIAGQGDQEAVVPIGTPFDDRINILFDNTGGFFSGVALVNATAQNDLVRVVARDNAGNVLVDELEVYLPGQKRVFLVQDRYPALANKVGTLTYTVAFGRDQSGITGLGLRFNPTGSFTSTFPLKL